MKDPSFNFRLARFVGAALLAFGAPVFAQPTDKPTNKAASPRAKAQVIYHLPPSSNYAATLHSQAKGQNNDLPVDSSMPTSLQILCGAGDEATALRIAWGYEQATGFTSRRPPEP